jgi:periplasmic divalent cation tolerance protein
MFNSSLYVVLCTFPDMETARRIGRMLVEEGLSACVNVLPGMQSVYQWEGKVESAEEALAMMKTTEKAYPRLEAMLKKLHPYETPEIVALPVKWAEEGYEKWVGEVTGGKEN